MSDREDMLLGAVQSVSTPNYMTGKDQIVAYYRDTYGTKWRGAIVQELAPITGLKKKSLQRRFDPSRLSSRPRTAKAKDEYRQLGEKLPPVDRTPNKSSITITVKGKSEGRKRTVTATFSGVEAYKFVNDPEFIDIWEDYGVDGGLFEGGDYELEVASVTAA